MTLPSSHHAEGDTTHITDHNAIAAYLAVLPLNIKDYGAAVDGVTNDHAAVVAAAQAASAVGGGTVLIPGPVALGSAVNLNGINNVTFWSPNNRLGTFTSLVTSTQCFNTTGDCSNIVFDGIGFIGTAVDDCSSPRRSRTYGATKISTAISLLGDLSTFGATAVIENVTVRNCYFYGTSSLPIFFGGIHGRSAVFDSEFENCFDVGFTHNDHAVFQGNRVTKSCDNGVSLSRGNRKVNCVGNDFDNCCYWAIWIAGFSNELGPKDIAIAGNTGVHLGYGGVNADIGPQHFTITGNTFRDIQRGPSDGVTDTVGVGIRISGNPSGSATPTDYAENWTVAGNTIIDAARGGIIVRGAKNGGIYGNTIIRPGSQYKADGVTLVTTGMAEENFGIAAQDGVSDTVSNVDVQSNTIIDDRGTPYMVHGVYGGSAVNWTQNDNRVTGARLTQTDSARTITGGSMTFTGTMKFTGAVRTGFLGATGTVSSTITGGAGSVRQVRLDTDDVARWSIQADSTSESGSNAGSNLKIIAYDDAGAALFTPVSVDRTTGAITLSMSATGKSFLSNNSSGGIVLKSANGHYWRATVDNSGTISTSDLGTSQPTS